MKRMFFALCVIAALVQMSGAKSFNESVCSEAGVTADPDDKSQFLICAERYGNTFVADTVSCPEGYMFSASARTCVNQAASTSSHRVVRDTKQCETSGPYCDGCDRMVVCAVLDGRGLTPISNISCSEIDSEMSCSHASCSTEPPTQPCGESASGFHCLQKGYFPDPADCTRYHVCTDDLMHYSGECEVIFDPVSGSCDPPEGTGECKTSPRKCESPNLAPASYKTSPSYYTLCIPKHTSSRKTPYAFSLSMMKCPEGHVFDDTKLTCIRSCAGKRGRFADPDNCRGFIECTDTVGPGTKKTCPENFAFEPKRRLCLPDFMTVNCTRNRTTRSIDSSSTSTTNSSNSSITTTTTVSPQSTTQKQNNNDFQCTTKGIFPDKNDCYSYFICSPVYRGTEVLLYRRRRMCPIFMYFNPRGYCDFGWC